MYCIRKLVEQNFTLLRYITVCVPVSKPFFAWLQYKKCHSLFTCVELIEIILNGTGSKVFVRKTELFISV